MAKMLFFLFFHLFMSAIFAEKPPKERQNLAYHKVQRDDIPVVNPTTPGTTPIVNPTSPVPPITTAPNPTTTSAAWCIANPSASQTALQVALDYACGYGGTDCSAIQPSRECWDPNTLVDHASYAFNDYYHKNPVPTSCVFGGAAQITNTDPSHGRFRFPTSTNTPTMPPPSPTTPPSAPVVLPPPRAGDSGDGDYEPTTKQGQQQAVLFC